MLHAALYLVGGFALCLIGVVFFPVRISLAGRFAANSDSPFQLVVRLWGLKILNFPQRRSRRQGWIGKKLSKWIESILTSSGAPQEDKPIKKPSTRRFPLKPSFVMWVAGRAMRLLARITRKIEVGCSGVDPALLGALTGVVAIAQGAFGTSKFRWNPDFTPGSLRIDWKWSLSISGWKLIVWAGESFLDRNRHHPKPSVFVVS
jgi:hypothetical protein